MGTVERLEYDPNRSTRIALVRYPEGTRPLSPALMSETPLCMPACYQYLSSLGSEPVVRHRFSKHDNAFVGAMGLMRVGFAPLSGGCEYRDTLGTPPQGRRRGTGAASPTSWRRRACARA